MRAGPLSEEEVRQIDAYWRAANYLSVGQIYLLDNPLNAMYVTGPGHGGPGLVANAYLEGTYTARPQPSSRQLARRGPPA